MKLAVDVEMVLANTHAPVLEKHNDAFGTDYNMSDVTFWEWVDDDAGGEIEFDWFMETTEAAWKHDLQSIQPFEDDIGPLLAEVAGLHFVDIVTARTGVEEQMRQWLASHGITAYDTFHSYAESSKADLAYDVYIDDKPYLADALDRSQHHFMIQQPYNQEYWLHDRVTAVPTVTDALQDILDGS